MAAVATGQATVSGTIAGAGASSQAAAMEAWIAGFTGANPDATINYDPSGSGAGRDQFIGGGVAFAGTDAVPGRRGAAPGPAALRRPDSVLELPVYVSPIAVVYNLRGVDDLQLAPATIAEIFDRQDHQVERPGDRSGQPRQDAARRWRSPR